MELKFDLLAIVQQLEDTPEGTEQFLSELLFFPEFRSFGNDPDTIIREQRELARKITRQLPGDGLVRRGIPGEVEAETLTLKFAPPQRSRAWTEPVQLEISVVTWQQDERTRVAYVPVLQIEVIASDADRLEEMLKSHIGFELKRRRFADSLLKLTAANRARDVKIQRVPWEAQLQTPTEHIKISAPEKERVLPKVGTRMEVSRKPEAYGRDAEVSRVAKLLTGRHPSCVLLVGESGTGKTAITLELARLRGDLGFGGREFWRSSGSRIVAGQTGFGMWQQRCTHIIEEARDTHAVICLGNLHELMQVGQSTASSESIAAFLRPAMVRSDLLAIAECTPGQLAAIEARDPKILDPFRRVQIDPPEPDAARAILAEINNEPDARLPQLEDEALRKLDSLHRRYMTYSAFPGRPATFLRGLRAEAASDDRSSVTASEVTAAFSRETGLPALMLEEAIPFEQAAVRSWFVERVHAQDQAVDLVIDRLAIIKAQLSRPHQPLASFLFAGPTGVGKTELAKTLAEFLYGSKDRMLRLDMSEFGSPSAASRLVASDFTGGEGLLTSRVRDQPFSVVLLDEFEKAHPSLFDLFLQVLGEGRLTDAAGRLADFSNCVIIMTSNLGAESYAKPELGFGGDGEGESVRRDAQEHFVSVVKETFRPEFFNRIDRVIPFAPLGRDAIRSIAGRELEIAAKRDGLAGNRIALELTPTALEHVVETGHDPRYGARPLKRAIEQRVLLPVSEFLNRSPRSGGCVTVDLPAGAVDLKVSYSEDEGPSIARQQLALVKQIDHAAALRRDYSLLASSPLVGELQSERRRIERQKAAAERRLQRNPNGPAPRFDPAQEARLALAAELLDRLYDERLSATRAEVSALVEYNANSSGSPLPGEPDSTDSPPPSPADFNRTLIEIFAATRAREDSITLTFISNHPRWMFDLAMAYREILSPAGARFTAGVFRRKDHDTDFIDAETGELMMMPVAEEDFAALAGGPDGDIGALVLACRRGQSTLRLADEAGLHQRISEGRGREACLVSTSDAHPSELRLAPDQITRVRTKELALRRTFDEVKATWKDSMLQSMGHPDHKGRGVFFSAKLLAGILEDTLQTRARTAMG